MHYSLSVSLGDILTLLYLSVTLVLVMVRYERRITRIEERLEPLWREFLSRAHRE